MSKRIKLQLYLDRLVLPVEAIHHLELSSEVLLGEVVKHAGVHQGLHEVGAVLR